MGERLTVRGPTAEHPGHVTVTRHRVGSLAQRMLIPEDDARLLAYALMGASQGSEETVEGGRRIKGSKFEPDAP